MAQTSVILVTLAVLGTLGGLAYVHASRNRSPEGPEVSASAPLAAAREPVHSGAVTTSGPAASSETPSTTELAPPRQSTADEVARSIADTRSNDAKTRASAIEALANAPRSQAIPALERVLESGDPQVDRQMALRSLHVLALNEGDDDGAIREVVRHAMYHGDDENVTQSAQAVLEDIEAALDERAESTR